MTYASIEYYQEEYLGTAIKDEDALERALKQASRHIDTLTFNRINATGLDNLTDFQKEIIREVVCLQADFEVENKDELESILASYSLNGVSASFGSSWNVITQQGVAMKRDVYTLLSQTGLTCQLAR